MKTLIAIAALLAAVNAQAEAEPLTAGEAVRIALENSPMLQAASAEAEAASARAKQAKGHRLPSIDLVELYHRTNNPAEVFAFQLNQERFDMAAFFAADPNNPDYLDTFMTRVELVQPLYTGGKLSSRIRQAYYMADAEERQRSRTEELVAFETLTAFTDLAKAREFHDLMLEARETVREHVRLAERYSDTGLIVEADLLRARVHLASVEELVQQAEGNSRLAEAALNFHMGVEQGGQRRLAPLTSAPEIEGDLESLMSAALARRADLAAARSKLDAGRLEEKVARAGYLPEVAFIGRYDLYDDVIFGDHGDSGAVMLNARLNIFRGGSDRRAVEAAVHQVSAYEANITRFEEGIRLQVRQAWQDLLTAKARQETARASLEAAGETLRITERRFEQGLDKMVDLLDAETALREAEVRELVARYDSAFAAYRLNFATGTEVYQ
jgi:outer membrane protein TolC